MQRVVNRPVRQLVVAGLSAGVVLLVGFASSSHWRAVGSGQEDPDSSPALLRHPYLQKGTSRSMGIAWMIDDEQPCSVEFGLTQQLGQVVESPESRRMHFVEVANLEPDTRY